MIGNAPAFKAHQSFLGHGLAPYYMDCQIGTEEKLGGFRENSDTKSCNYKMDIFQRPVQRVDVTIPDAS